MSTPEQIVVRGKDLCSELIGKVSFTEHVWLLASGSMPSRAQCAALDAALVAIAEHGLVPSVQAARMTYAAAPEAFQGAVAAGLLGCGSVILGAAELAALFLHNAQQGDGDVAARALDAVQKLRNTKKPIPGYGHPFHKARDPRTARLMEVARDHGLFGAHCEMAAAVELAIPQVTGKHLVLNVSGAIPALLLDAGYAGSDGAFCNRTSYSAVCPRQSTGPK